jgi:ubiquinone/menaquinone biosynthesis C-methylase UbiE
MPITELKPAGSEDTKEFYDRDGWKEESGVLKDTRLFGVKEDGPIKQAAHAYRMQRLLRKLGEAGTPLNLLECGCGGKPEIALLPLCASYTGIDFSATGLEVARQRLSRHPVPFELVEGDICDMPFSDGRFDAVYSAHAIYHIPDPRAQAAAFREALRVTRPGGIAVFVMANPYPLAFPIRLIRRLAADAPGISHLLNAIRRKPPLPYRPMSLGWTRGKLAPFGNVSVEVHAMASTWFAQSVSDRYGVGKLLWKLCRHVEQRHPGFAGHLGNYVQITVRKRSQN